MVFALIAFGLFVISTTGRAVNRFSAELVWVCFAAAATAQSGSRAVAVAYLVSLYLWAGPSPRFRFPFRRIEVSDNEVAEWFRPITISMPPGARIGFCFMARDMAEFRRECKYLFLLNAWAASTDYKICSIARPEIGMGDIRGDDHAEVARKNGIEWLLIPASAHYTGSVVIGPCGSVEQDFYWITKVQK